MQMTRFMSPRIQGVIWLRFMGIEFIRSHAVRADCARANKLTDIIKYNYVNDLSPSKDSNQIGTDFNP